MPTYIPKPGDVVWVDFDPQAGSEMSKRRPALVLSPERYNQKVGLMICCLMTSKIKGYPFEVRIQDMTTPSVVLSDQVKSIDWRARRAELKGRASLAELQHVKQMVVTLLDIY